MHLFCSGIREADINVAEGKRQSRILASEAEKQEEINKADGKAKALIAMAQARAVGLKVVAEQLKQKPGNQAASLLIAENYVQAFGSLAKNSNTLILPSNAGNTTHLNFNFKWFIHKYSPADVSSVVAQAMATYKTINDQQNKIFADSEKETKSEESESSSRYEFTASDDYKSSN